MKHTGAFRPSATTWLLLACALLPFLSSAFVIAWIPGLFVDALIIRSGHPWQTGLWLAFVWLVSPILLTPWHRLELWLNRRFYKLREPTKDEQRRLFALLQRVSAAAGGIGEVDVYVAEAAELNALAAGRRTLAVTEGALVLDDRRLEAVLAHEIGHPTHRHPTALALTGFFSLPLRVFDLIARVLTSGNSISDRAVRFIVGSFRSLISIPAAIGLNATAVIMRRRAEFEADQWAADRGYGTALADVLSHVADTEVRPVPQRLGWLPVSTRWHPSLGERIARLHGSITSGPVPDPVTNGQGS